MSKQQKQDNGISYGYRQNPETLRAMKRIVEFERGMQTRMIARARIHAVKMTNRSNNTALKGKNAYYIAAFLGRSVTPQNMRDMIAQSTATATLSDGLAATGSPAIERPARKAKKQ